METFCIPYSVPLKDSKVGKPSIFILDSFTTSQCRSASNCMELETASSRCRLPRGCCGGGGGGVVVWSRRAVELLQASTAKPAPYSPIIARSGGVSGCRRARSSIFDMTRPT